MKQHETSAIGRRNFLRGALAMSVAVPLGVTLASCSSGSGSDGAGTVTKSAKNPFGLKNDTSIEVYMFNGGYGYDWATYAANEVKKRFSGIKTTVTPTTDIGKALQPRFVAGNPPDLVCNAGGDQIPFVSILNELEKLDGLFDVKNYEGKKIGDAIYPGVKEAGSYNDTFVAFNYVLTIYGMWYSASLFEREGWQPPKTWDETLALGAAAKKKGKYLFTFGKEAASYYQTLAINSAIKEGGRGLIDKLNNADPNAWSDPALQGVFQALEKAVKDGYFIPGGSGTQFTAAQAKWSNDEQAILYPSGSWIQNEMKKATKDGFKMTAAPEPTLTSSPQLTYQAVRSSAGEPFTVPLKGKNPAGAKEVLRALLSKDAAANFSKTRLAPTVVKGSVPDGGYGSTALQSVTAMIDAAGDNVFDLNFDSKYGLGSDQLVAWNGFLSGQINAKALTSQLQKLLDKAAKSAS